MKNRGLAGLGREVDEDRFRIAFPSLRAAAIPTIPAAPAYKDKIVKTCVLL